MENTLNLNYKQMAINLIIMVNLSYQQKYRKKIEEEKLKNELTKAHEIIDGYFRQSRNPLEESGVSVYPATDEQYYKIGEGLLQLPQSQLYAGEGADSVSTVAKDFYLILD